jgi:NTP pyrophosphatase (non-canonical NTP hydrolase)
MWKIQKKIESMMKARGWDKTAPADQAKSIMIEGAELLEHFQWKNFTIAEIKKDKEKYEAIQSEVADVLIYAIDLATNLGVDVEKIVSEKIKKVEKKYPAGIIKRDKAAYWNIKKQYRKDHA